MRLLVLRGAGVLSGWLSRRFGERGEVSISEAIRMCGEDYSIYWYDLAVYLRPELSVLPKKWFTFACDVTGINILRFACKRYSPAQDRAYLRRASVFRDWYTAVGSQSLRGAGGEYATAYSAVEVWYGACDVEPLKLEWHCAYLCKRLSGEAYRKYRDAGVAYLRKLYFSDNISNVVTVKVSKGCRIINQHTINDKYPVSRVPGIALKEARALAAANIMTMSDVVRYIVTNSNMSGDVSSVLNRIPGVGEKTIDRLSEMLVRLGYARMS